MGKQISNVYKISILTLGQGVNIIVNFLFMPYMARALSYIDYGTYGQTILIISLATTLLAFGLAQVIFIYLNKQSYDPKTVLFNNVLSGISLGALGSLILFFVSDWIAHWFNNTALTDYIQIYAFSIIFSIPNFSINSYLIFSNKVKQSVIILVLSNILKVSLIVISIQLYQSLTYVFLSIVISEMVRFLSGLLVIRNNIKLQFDFSLIKEQVKFGFPLALTGILGIAILYTDGLMVSKLLGIKEYAIYRNGAIEVPFIATIYGSIAAIIMPEVSKLWSNEKHLEIKKLKFKVINYTAVLIYPVMIFFLFNSQEFITLYLGDNYQDSAVIFMVFNLTLLIRINDYSDALIASGNSKYILYSYLLTLFVNIVLNYLFITWWGGVGAAISTVSSIFILAVLQFRKTLKIVRGNLNELINLKLILRILLISVAIAFLTKKIPLFLDLNGRIQFIITALIYFSLIYYTFSRLKIIPIEIIQRLLPFKSKKHKI